MKRRPWPIVLLALLQLLCPLGSIVVSSLAWWVTPWQIVATAFHDLNFYQQLDLIGLPILAAASIFAFRPWSYPVFLAISLWTVVANAQTWVATQHGFSAGWLAGLTFLNVAFVSYFLAPSVRLAYFNSRVRWWESLPRFRTDLEATAEVDGSTLPCRVEDLSSGGALIGFETGADAKELRYGDEVRVAFQFLHQQYTVRAQVVHQRPGAPTRYGVRFRKDEETSRVARLTGALDLLGFPRRLEVTPWHVDLRTWARTLPSQGWRAFFPAVPAKPTAPEVDNVIPLRPAATTAVEAEPRKVA